jgi:uncharacterized membrane protein YphA (DoxX/SURF4 family)
MTTPYGPMRYVTLFARFYFGIHCLMSGANYYLHFSKTGAMLDPATIQFMDAITAIGMYQGVKTLELLVGLCVLSGFMLPLALVLEFPVSIMIFCLGLYQGINIHLLTSLKEVLLNAFLFAAYAGYYLRILTPLARQRPLWARATRAEAGAFYRENGQ